MQSLLVPPQNNVCVIFVDPLSLDLLNTPYCLSKIYSLVKEKYSEVTSIHLLSFSLTFFIKNDIIEFHSMEVST